MLKRFLLLLFLTLSYCSFAQIQDSLPKSVEPTVNIEQLFNGYQIQMQVQNKSYQDLKQTEKELKVTYSAILKEYADNPEFISALHKSQEIWKQLKIADLKMRFPQKPNTALNVQYGSVVSMCMYQILQKFTRDRINYLNQWLKGIPEGDVCRGSIKMRNGN